MVPGHFRLVMTKRAVGSKGGERKGEKISGSARLNVEKVRVYDCGENKQLNHARGAEQHGCRGGDPGGDRTCGAMMRSGDLEVPGLMGTEISLTESRGG